mgnify:FL=1
MITVVGVRFKKAGKIYYFDPDDSDISSGDFAIVETARGIEFGEVVVGPKEVVEEDIIAPLKKVIRVASEEDKERNIVNKVKEKQAFDICLKKIEEHELSMKLVDVEYTFDNNKVIFYFTADGRVDFRELVKDLASIFKTRIELRQIGVRDEAKMVGGLGPCGRPMCCSSFLGEFEPVSIKMAKEQSLSLNPTKISGICGRLMCCLKYEQDTYECIRKHLPRVGCIVRTCDGEGEVVANNTVKESVKVKIAIGDEEETRVYPMTDVTIVSGTTEGEVVDDEIEIEHDEDVTCEEINNILKDS